MILGLDWLQSFSPMQIHWQQRWLSIPYDDKLVVLYGDTDQIPVGSMLHLTAAQTETPDDMPTDLPPEIAALLHDFYDLFQQPTELPPPRSCDHSIPLMEGATPVFIRPYHYAPILKTEIERQVTKMLQQGIIQKSTSPFSSPVILVKKKDNSWRFCVDYRHLNAITVKGKFPVPIIDELLDELAGASWFTSLDL
jgi:hypothetical protein